MIAVLEKNKQIRRLERMIDELQLKERVVDAFKNTSIIEAPSSFTERVSRNSPRSTTSNPQKLIQFQKTTMTITSSQLASQLTAKDKKQLGATTPLQDSSLTINNTSNNITKPTQAEKLKLEGEVTKYKFKCEMYEKDIAKLKTSRLVVTVENEKLNESLAETKKKLAECDQYRKEAVTLKISNRCLEADLNLAKKKVTHLQNDLNIIHAELTQFSENFESKLENTTREKEEIIEEQSHEIEQLKTELAHTKAQLVIQNKNIRVAKEAFRDLLNQLVNFNTLADTITAAATRELELKKQIIEDFTSSKQVVETVVNEVAVKITQEYFEETDKLRKDNVHLTKEVAELKKELVVDRSIAIGSDGDGMGDSKGLMKERPQLFTQGTLILDYPKLFGRTSHDEGHDLSDSLHLVPDSGELEMHAPPPTGKIKPRTMEEIQEVQETDSPNPKPAPKRLKAFKL